MDRGESSGGKETVYETLVQNGPPCAPRQSGIVRIPMLQFDISGSDEDSRFRRLQQYEDGAFLRLGRGVIIGPGVYYEKFITPRENPSNSKSRFARPRNMPRHRQMKEEPYSGHSFHIIEILYSEETNMRIQLLIRDYDLYLVAFRRSKNEVWSSWYYPHDSPIPDFFNGIELDFSGSHSKETDIGGTEWLKDMFFGFAKYPEDGVNGKAKLQKSLLRAVIIFCEALRVRQIYEAVLRALKEEGHPVDLEPCMWEAINNWGSLSEFVLTTGMNGGKMNQTKFREVVEPHAKSFSELIIGDNSVLMSLMRKEKVLLPKGIPAKLRRAGAGMNVAEPGFEAGA